MASALLSRYGRRRLIGFLLQARAVVYWIAAIPVLLVPDLSTQVRVAAVIAISLVTGLPFLTRATRRYTGMRLSAAMDIVAAYVLWFALPSAGGISLLLTIWAVASVVLLGSDRDARRTAIGALVAEVSKIAVLFAAPSASWIGGLADVSRPGEVGLVLGRSAVIVGAYVVFRSLARYASRLNTAAESGSERYRRLMDLTPTAFLVVVDSRVVYCNEAAEMLLGGPGGRVADTRFEDLVCEEQRLYVLEDLKRAQENLKAVELSGLTMKTTAGESRWVDVTMNVVDYGYDLAVQVAIVDRSDLREIRDRLKRTEVDFRSFFERIPVALYRSAPEGTILAANAALVDLFGAESKDEIIGIDAHQFYVESSDRDHLTSMLDSDEIVIGYEAMMRRLDGATMWIRDTSRSITTDAGVVYEGAMIDVTRRRGIEDELWARAVQQEAVASIGQIALEAAVITAVMESVTETVSTVLGTDGALVLERGTEGGFEMQGSGDFAGIAPDEVAAVADRAHMTAASVVLRNAEEVRFAAPGLAEHGIESAVAVTIPGTDIDFGTLVVISAEERIFTVDDLNFLQSVANVLAAAVDRANARARLEDLVRSKDAFVASVSHELRTPLTVVAGMAHELHDRWKEFTDAEMEEFTNLLVEQSKDMSDLIDDLLIAARANIGNVTVRSEPVELDAQIRMVLAGLSVSDDRTITASVESGFVDADAIRVRQILRNLMTNAIRYGGPNIEVRTSVSSGAMAVEVADDGAGIGEGDRERIFEAYERAHDAPGQPGSVGIGLTVSRTLAELMGGSLTYRFDGRSVFILELPRDLHKSPEQPDSSVSRDAHDGAVGVIRPGRMGVDIAAIE
jgi:PAS domain S-box-containing protein